MRDSSPDDLVLIANRFTVLGVFIRDVVYAKDLTRRCDYEHQELVLIKSTDLSTKERLLKEVEVYNALGSRNSAGFPVLRWFGEWDDMFCFAMDYRGCDLERLRFHLPQFFDPQTVALFAIQMIDRIRCLHSVGFIHGNIKPENFTFGPQQAGSAGKRGVAAIHLIGFGSAVRTKDEGSEARHYSLGMAFTSIRVLRGAPLTKIDDLESLAYTLIHLLGIRLPWMKDAHGLNGRSGRRCMAAMKSDVVPEMICRDLPPVYAEFLRYTREIETSIEPRYDTFILKFKIASGCR